MVDHFRTENKDTLYQSVKVIFTRQKPPKSKAQKPKASNEILSGGIEK
jgi:hypothetical protein